MVLATHLLIRLGLQRQLVLNVVFTNEERDDLFRFFVKHRYKTSIVRISSCPLSQLTRTKDEAKKVQLLPQIDGT